MAASVAGGRALIMSVPLAGTGSDARSDAALATLHGRAPLILAAVVMVAFLLLLLVFGSVAIPLISVGLNLLSVAAALGMVTLKFAGSHPQSLLGVTSFGAVVSWVPLVIFVFLFGISVDYHVVMLNRISELRGRGTGTKDAIVCGIGGGAGVVTSAAVIMVAVFSVLASLSIAQTKTLGVGIAVAVLIDATVVRGILLPAALALLLGERRWYRPRWLWPGWQRAGQLPTAR